MTRPTNLTEPTHRGTVYPWHCDHMGHMNVMWYVAKFDEATWNLFAQVGITPAYLRDAGCGMVAVDQHLTYERELLAGDVVSVHSEVLDVRPKVIVVRHVMTGGATGDVAATTTITGVHLDRSTRRSCLLPDDILGRARSSMRPQPPA